MLSTSLVFRRLPRERRGPWPLGRPHTRRLKWACGLARTPPEKLSRGKSKTARFFRGNDMGLSPLPREHGPHHRVSIAPGSNGRRSSAAFVGGIRRRHPSAASVGGIRRRHPSAASVGGLRRRPSSSAFVDVHRRRHPLSASVRRGGEIPSAAGCGSSWKTRSVFQAGVGAIRSASTPAPASTAPHRIRSPSRGAFLNTTNRRVVRSESPLPTSDPREPVKTRLRIEE
jgi:hypothetical protein